MLEYKGQPVQVVGAEAVYLRAFLDDGSEVHLGEFPHCRMRRPGDKKPQCRETIDVTDRDATTRERCTRERGHGPLHVKHLAPGMPIVAWRRS